MDGEINDLSIANLTKVADLKRTSTYKFFPHPDDIKIALIERYINELKEKLENFNVSSSEHHQTLKELINEIYLYFKENISAQKIILANTVNPVSYTHLRAHETSQDLVCRLLLEKKK